MGTAKTWQGAIFVLFELHTYPRVSLKKIGVEKKRYNDGGHGRFFQGRDETSATTRSSHGCLFVLAAQPGQYSLSACRVHYGRGPIFTSDKATRGDDQQLLPPLPTRRPSTDR